MTLGCSREVGHPAIAKQSISERRRGGRRQDLRYSARIENLADGVETACTILDVSQTGARLIARDPDQIGEEFLLRLAVGRQAQRHCEVVWRDGATMGVRFLVAPEPGP